MSTWVLSIFLHYRHMYGLLTLSARHSSTRILYKSCNTNWFTWFIFVIYDLLPTGKHFTFSNMFSRNYWEVLDHTHGGSLSFLGLVMTGNLKVSKIYWALVSFCSESISNLQLDDRRIIAKLWLLNPLDMSVMVLEKYWPWRTRFMTKQYS